MNPIFKRAFRSAFWKMLLYSSGFCLNLAIARGLGASESAPVYYLLNNLGLLVMFMGLGLENTLSFFYSRGQLTKGQSLLLAAGWSVTITMVFILLNEWLRLVDPSSLGLQKVKVYGYLLGALLTTQAGSIYYAQHRSGLPNLVPAILNMVLTVYCIVHRNHLQEHLSTVAGLLLLFPLITGIFLFLTQATAASSRVASGFLSLKTLLGYSLLVFATVLSNGLFTRGDIWLLEHLAAPHLLGNYIQTTKFAQLALLIPLMASFSLFPSFTQHMNEGEKVPLATLHLSGTYCYLVLFFCLAAAVSAPLIFPLFYGDSYSLMGPIFLCMTPGLVASATSYPMTTYFAAANQNDKLIRTLLESVVMLVIAFYLGWQQLGINGAAIGWSIANVYYCGRLMQQFKLVYPFSLLEAFAPKPFLLLFRQLLKEL